MKKIFTILALAATLGFATSCQKFLTEEVRGQQNLDSYFASIDDAELYVTGCYEALTCSGWWQVNTVWLLSEMCSDDAWMGNTTQSQSDYISLAHYQGNGASNGPISNFWQYRYKGILRCNVGIVRISGLDVTDTELRDRFVAEMRFLRAFFYFELCRNFGGVPLVEGFLMPEEIEGITRTSQEDVYDFIASELEAAAEVLPERSAYPADDLGRATKGAALGLLGKVLVYQEKWDEARTVLKSVIDSGEYQLLPEFGMVWDMEYDNSIESLFEVQYTYDQNLATGGSLATVTGARNGPGDGWSWCQPTAHLENAYLEAGDTERLRWTIIKSGCTEIAGEENFNLFVENNGTVSNAQDLIDRFGWDQNCYIINPSQHKSARLIRKYFLPTQDRPEVYNTDKSPLNHRILRYADILLLYAEACNQLGDDANALDALNQVRNRAKLASLNVSGTALRDAIRNERRLELAFEQNRLYDIRRWKDDSGQPVIASIMGRNGSFVQWNLNEATRDVLEWENQGESSNKGETFDVNRDLLFPIPLYEITMSNGSITQNPGWK